MSQHLGQGHYVTIYSIMTSDVHFFWNFIFNPQSTLFFIRILDLSLSLNIFSVLSLRLLQTFLNMESVTTSEKSKNYI